MDKSLGIKTRLRFTTIENIFKYPIKKRFPDYIVDLLHSLMQYDDAINTILHFIQQPQKLITLIEIFKVFYSYFQEHPEKIKNPNFSEKVLLSILNCININASNPKSTNNANNLKIDNQTMGLIYYSAKFSSLMVSELPELLHPMPTNPYVLTFLLSTTSCLNNEDFDELLPFVEPFFTSKLTLSPYSFGTICIMSTHDKLDGLPSLKNLISFFKSLSDKPVIQVLTPFVLRAALLRLSPSTLKEIPTLISFLSSKMIQDDENSPLFSQFIGKIIEMPDSISIIKPFCEPLFKLYIRNIRNELPLFESNENSNQNSENDNPLNYVNECIGTAFCVLMYFCSINPFDSFFVSRLERQTDNVILMMTYIVDHVNKFSNYQRNYTEEKEEEPISSLVFNAATFDPVLLALKKIDANETTTKLYFHFCGTIIDYYESKNAVNALIQGLENNINLASTILIAHCLNFSFVFENISRSLKPGKSSMLLVTTLKIILQNHAKMMMKSHSNTSVVSPSSSSSTATDEVNTGTDDINNGGNGDTFSRSGSESTNFELPDFDRFLTVLPESAIETAPTDATILFCSVFAALDKFPEMFDLLPDSASAISPLFSNSLMVHFPKLKSQKFKSKVLSAFSNACHTLDIADIYSLTQTFMMLLPGQSMLYLAITLQRLPRSIVTASLLKTIPFIWDNPNETGKMIALVSYSHPDVSIEFIETVITNSTLRKRTFFIFRASESNDQALIVIFKIIGYCSIFIDINYFVSSFLPFATQLLNKYLTHQSKSPVLYSASLFAIKKISIRVQSLQDERFEHVFPFKDFLVQYVCAYYLDVGFAIIHSLESSVGVSSSSDSDASSILSEPASLVNGHLSNNNDVESLLKNVPKILATLTSMLPLRPIRPYDRHERSVELTTAMIQISDDNNFKSIFEASKMFFCTLLDCNPSISVFSRIVVPIFQALLRNPRWSSITDLLELICSKYCSKLNIQQSSDVLSKTISNIELLVAYAVPLTLQGSVDTDAVKDKIARIIFSLVSLQCSIRNQILSLPQSIRPVKPETNGLSPTETNCVVCNFIEKYFTSSQTFELIMTLLSFFLNKSPMLQVHHYGTALCIKKLIMDRGAEDFRYDGKISQSLVKASINEEEDVVVTIFIDVIEILLKMRLFSMLSNIMLSNEISDKFFDGIMKRLSNIEEGETKLLTIIADFFESNEIVDVNERKNMNEFSFRAIPYLSNSMKTIDNDTWVKLFIGVANKVQKIDSNLLNCLVGNEQYNDYYDFAQIIARERLLALQVILSKFPENPTKFFIKMAIAFASTEPETCEGFLNYAVTAMLRKISCFSSFSMMQNLFESDSIQPKYWIGLSESLSALFIQNMRCRTVVVDCTIAFINRIDEFDLQEFWISFADICAANVEKWVSIIKRLISEGKVHFPSISSILPELILHSQEKQFEIVLNLIASKLGLEFDSEKNNVFDVCEMIMKSDCFKENCDDFLKLFVATLKEKRYVFICCCIIERLCNKIDENNIYAIDALIETMNWMKEGDNKFVLEIIMRILN